MLHQISKWGWNVEELEWFEFRQLNAWLKAEETKLFARVGVSATIRVYFTAWNQIHRKQSRANST